MSQLSSIGRLLLHACPFAVPWLIPFVVVNPLDSQPIWTLTHVFRERLKAIGPPFAHCDAPCSIEPVTFIARVQTSLFYLRPNMPELGVASSVRCGPNGEGYQANATTTNRISSANVVHALEARGSTIAFEFPQYAAALTFICWLDGYQSAKSLPGQVEGDSASCHSLII